MAGMTTPPSPRGLRLPAVVCFSIFFPLLLPAIARATELGVEGTRFRLDGKPTFLLGISYYAGFSGRASAVFGAMPSMHCAYPLIGLLSAWRVSRLPARLVHVGYVAIMALAAMYLDHHWAVDVVAGWFTALASVVIARAWLNYRGRVSERAREPVKSRPRPSSPRPSRPSSRRFDRPTPAPVGK
jgi:membrane-associated phospholipid phosphatase